MDKAASRIRLLKSQELHGKVSRKVCKTRRFTPKSLNFYGFRAAKSDEKARF